MSYTMSYDSSVMSEFAKTLANHSTCPILKTGCVICDVQGNIVSYGCSCCNGTCTEKMCTIDFTNAFVSAFKNIEVPEYSNLDVFLYSDSDKNTTYRQLGQWYSFCYEMKFNNIELEYNHEVNEDTFNGDAQNLIKARHGSIMTDEEFSSCTTKPEKVPAIEVSFKENVTKNNKQKRTYTKTNNKLYHKTCKACGDEFDTFEFRQQYCHHYKIGICKACKKVFQYECSSKKKPVTCGNPECVRKIRHDNVISINTYRSKN